MIEISTENTPSISFNLTHPTGPTWNSYPRSCSQEALHVWHLFAIDHGVVQGDHWIVHQEGGPEGPEAATPLREMRFDGDIKQNYLYVSKRKGIHVRCILKHSTWKTYFHVVRCCWKRKPNSWFLGVFLRTTSSRIYRWYRCNQYPLFDTLCKWIYNIIWLRPLYDMYVMSIRVNRISYGTCLSLSCCEHLTKTNALFL